MNILNTNIITRRVLLLTLAVTPVLLAPMALAHGGLEHVRGTVAKVSDQSVTVTTTAGKTVEVLLDAADHLRASGQTDSEERPESGRSRSDPRRGEGNYAHRAYRRGGSVRREETLIGAAPRE